MTDKLRFGFFRFSDPTILFFGSAEALSSFRDALLSLKDRSPLRLEEDQRFISLNNTKLAISLGGVERGLHRTKVHSSTFTWRLSEQDLTAATDKISAVIKSETPSHHYLESVTDDLVVVVSKDEYPETFAP